MTNTLPWRELNDGATIPAIGFGTYPLLGPEGTQAIVTALEVGYRLLDSAVNYRNESEVGTALRDSGIPRDEVRITTKVPGRFHERSLAVASVEESLRIIGLDYLDLALIHWPNPSQDRYVSAWEGLIECRERGLVRSIGVSNFESEHLTRIIDATGVPPAVNQIELHPLFPQVELRAENTRLGIVTQAWSPLGKRQAQYAAEPVLAAAAAHDVTPAQAILRWHLDRGVLPLPKSATPARQAENLDLAGFTLTVGEVADITALGRTDGRLFGGDPHVHEED